MTHHFWGDDWFKKHGDDLWAAELYIFKFTKKWSGCTLLSKEKYGTIRYEYIVPPGGSAFRLKFPIFAPWKKKFTFDGKVDYYHPLLFAWNECWIYKKWALFGAWVCGKVVKKAVKKWPHLEAELCTDFLFDTKFGRECEKKYWKSI